MKIEIEGLRKTVRLGVSTEERSTPQEIKFDITLELNSVKCTRSDDLNDTVDYVQVDRIVQQLCDECEWKLIEKLCSDVGREILSRTEILDWAEVKVTKRVLPDCDGVSARIRVSRECD